MSSDFEMDWYPDPPKALMGTTWTTGDGRVLEVSEMTPQHAQNIINMIEGRSKYSRHGLGIWLDFAAWPNSSSLRTYPLGQALYERASEKPTLSERRADMWGRVQWRLRRTPVSR